LIPKPILLSAIRALPRNSIAGHSPNIFFHALLADTETTPALPTKRKIPAAAVARIVALFAAFAPVRGGW
jgi:hypothetical protein